MARQPRFIPKQTPRGWCLNVPAKFTASKNRERQYFKSRALAEAAAKALKERKDKFGAEATIIGPALAAQATEAAAILASYPATIVDAARFYAQHQERNAASVPLTDALTEFRKRKEGRSTPVVSNYRQMADHLIREFPDRTLSTITGAEIEAHIEKRAKGSSMFNHYLALIGAFWRWCAKKPRNWCDAEEVDQIERREATTGHIGTLTADECRKLMETAEDYYPDTVPAFAIALFTGMRRGEIGRLQPSDITSEGITVPASSAKTRRRRFIHMPEPLAAWLEEYPITDAVTPPNWYRKQRAVRRLAGWRIYSDLVRPCTPPPELPEWPDNALRHTAATVALALGKPIETLVFEHGHSGGLNVLRNHYIGQMTKKEALAIWSLGPKGRTIEAIRVA